MGWANCGTDSKGRLIGYAHDATCDHPGCEKVIHRGLAHACGGMHGTDEYSCEGYFCADHLGHFIPGAMGAVCKPCHVQAQAICAGPDGHEWDGEECQRCGAERCEFEDTGERSRGQ